MSEHRTRLLDLINSFPVKWHNNWGNISVGLMRGTPLTTCLMDELYRVGKTMSNQSMKRVLDNTKPDEPVFILCGRDATAPTIIRAWAAEARARGTSDQKTAGAIAIAENMEQWQREHPELVKVPD